MSLEVANLIAQWTYRPPSDRYNIGSGFEAYMCDPANGFIAVCKVATADSDVIAFASRGVDGRVPGYDYDDTALDFGFAMNPDFRGQGLGALAIDTALRNYVASEVVTNFRASVWAHNTVMAHVLGTLGFVETGRFTSRSGDPFVIFLANAGRFAT